MIHHIENGQIVEEVIKSDKLIIIDFFAEWCGPCQMLTEVLRNVDKKYEGKIEIFKVDVDNEQAIALRYGITAMPTLIFFKDGKEIEREVGYVDENTLSEMIEDFLD